MGVLSMSKAEREAFLADLHVGVLAVERDDGPPLAAPVWYRYAPGGVIEVATERASRKAQLVEACGRATLCAQREALPYAYVTVEGPAELAVADDLDAVRREIAVRYLGEQMGEAYLESSAVVDDVLIRLTPERWRTADFGKLEMPGG